MKILIIGRGGREHAIAWKLSQSKQTEKIFIARGNAGTAQIAENVPIDEFDFPALIKFAKQNNIGLTIVGPEAPLAAGIVDAFEKEGLRIFGPNKKAAQIEASKIFCKEMLKKGVIPTGGHAIFDSVESAVLFLEADRYKQVVIKADGLAAGKGVVVCDNREQAIEAVERMLKYREFGAAGEHILIEERLNGQEASVLAITDGNTILTLPPAQDHKAVFDGDQGPNTGGMGAFTPARLISDEKLHWIEEHVLVPTVHTMKQLDCPFKGVLYAGLMLTNQGPRVLEYNARFGDPECQPILMRMKTDLLDVLNATVDGTLEQIESLEWDKRVAVCVVMTSGGYPGTFERGFPISGLEEAAALPDVYVFHSGTKIVDGKIVTDGGRVLGVCGLGETTAAAKTAAYEAVSRINFKNAFYRKDISDKAI